MGLDSVELVMAVEETFGVSISDAEAVRCETPVSLWMLTGFVLLGLFRVTDPEFAWAGAALAGIAGMLFTSRFANRIPRTHSTVRDLVPFALTSTEISWSPNDVAWQVKKLVMEQLGVSEKDYREDAHFIHDFGMD